MRLLGIPRDLTTEAGAVTPTWGELPPPVPDDRCQLCEDDLDGQVTDDGLCAACRRLLDAEDAQAWFEAGGRTCRRCHNVVPVASIVGGCCPCGGEAL